MSPSPIHPATDAPAEPPQRASRGRAAGGAGLGLLAAAALAALVAGCTPAREGGIMEALAERRESESASLDRAEALSRGGRLDAALQVFERAIERNPELTPAYLGAGNIYRQRGDYAQAERRYARAVELEPQNFDAQYAHAVTLQWLERLSEAVRAYLRALAIRPQDFDANLNLASAYLQMGEPEQARVYARRAISIDGESGEARATLGSVYAAMGQHESAVAEYQQAAELMELTPELLLNLADSLSRTGRHAEAISTLQQALRLEPTAQAYERLGAVRFRMEAYDMAQDAFSEALELDANHYPALNGLAVCHLNEYLWSDERDKAAKQEAVRLLRRSLQIKPSQPRIVDLLRRYG